MRAELPQLLEQPKLFRDQGGGKGLCDLLLVMPDNVVFSDKRCVLEPKKSLELYLSRWFTFAIGNAAEQGWVAECWLHRYEDSVSLDSKYSQRPRVPLPYPSIACYHLVAP